MSSNWPSPPPPLCPGEDSQAVWPLLCRSPDGCHSEHPGKWRQRSAADGQRPVILPGVLGWVSILPAISKEVFTGDGVVPEHVNLSPLQ